MKVKAYFVAKVDIEVDDKYNIFLNEDEYEDLTIREQCELIKNITTNVKDYLRENNINYAYLDSICNENGSKILINF